MKESTISEILEWINSIKVDIADDPVVAGGMKYISRTLARIHSYCEELESYMRQVMLDLRQIDRSLITAEREYEFEFSELLATNDDVREQRSFRDREALARSLLKAQVETIEELKLDKHSLEQFERILKLKMAHLNRANRDIRLQEKSLSNELRLSGTLVPDVDEPGEFSENYRKAREPIKLEDDEDLPDDLFDEVGGTATESEVPANEPLEEPLPSEETDTSPGEEPASSSEPSAEDDLESILAESEETAPAAPREKKPPRKTEVKPEDSSPPTAFADDSEIDIQELFGDL